MDKSLQEQVSKALSGMLNLAYKPELMSHEQLVASLQEEVEEELRKKYKSATVAYQNGIYFVFLHLSSFLYFFFYLFKRNSMKRAIEKEIKSYDTLARGVEIYNIQPITLDRSRK